MNVFLVQPRMPGLESWAPPLGLLSLATVLRSHSVDCQVFDLNDGVSESCDLQAALTDTHQLLLGITATIANWREALRLADGAPCPVVFGGPHPTVDPAAFICRDNYFVVRGEGEEILPIMIRRLTAGESPLGLPGVCGRIDGELTLSDVPPPLASIDSLPIPDRTLVSLPRYRLRLDGREATTMLTTRGCPFSCRFCYNGFLGRSYRTRPAGHVVDEMELLHREFSVGGIVFYDDNFTHDVSRVRAICREIRARRLDLLWRCYARVGTLDAATLQEMRDAGCVGIVFGAESGSPETLSRLRKGIRVEQTLAAGEMCGRVGIHGKFSLVIGFPWETEAHIQSTFSLIEKLAPNTTSLTLFTPFPGTELYNELIAQGREIDLSVDLTHLSTPTFAPDHITGDRLMLLLAEGRHRIDRATCSDNIELAGTEEAV